MSQIPNDGSFMANFIKQQAEAAARQLLDRRAAEAGGASPADAPAGGRFPAVADVPRGRTARGGSGHFAARTPANRVRVGGLFSTVHEVHEHAYPDGCSHNCCRARFALQGRQPPEAASLACFLTFAQGVSFY
jgi:hypothetical protein